MSITPVNNSPSFKGVHLHHISRNSKTGKYLLQASKQARAAKQIAALEQKGMVFDLVRVFDRDSNKTDSVAFYLGRKTPYFTKDGVNPLYTEQKITSLKDAKAFIKDIVAKAKAFLPEHLQKVEEFKQLMK